MFCDNCGKNNINGAQQCAYCGAPLSLGSATTGFSDILSYKQEPTAYTAPVSGGVSEDMVRSVGIKANQAIREAKKAKLYSLVSVAISFVLLLTTVVAVVISNKAVNKVEDDLDNHNALYHKDQLAEQQDEQTKEQTDVKEKPNGINVTDQDGEKLNSFKLEQIKSKSTGETAKWKEKEWYVKRIVVENKSDSDFEGALVLESENGYTEDINGNECGLADVVGVFCEDGKTKIDDDFVDKIKQKGEKNVLDGFLNIKNTFKKEIKIKAGDTKEYTLVFYWAESDIEFKDNEDLKATVTVKVEPFEEKDNSNDKNKD